MKNLTMMCAILPLALFATAGWAQDKKGEPKTVGKVLSIEYAIEESNPPTLKVTAVGEVPSGGFSKPTLTRVVYVTPPADGIQDYDFKAVPPSGPATTVISQVTGKDEWKGYTKDAPWLKGIRVRGIGDGIMVKMIAK